MYSSMYRKTCSANYKKKRMPRYSMKQIEQIVAFKQH